MELAIHELMEAARKLGPFIREHADEAERERRPSKPVMDAMAEAGLFRMLTPRSLGGLEVDPSRARGSSKRSRGSTARPAGL